MTRARKQRIAYLYRMINQNFEQLSALLNQKEDEPASEEKETKKKDPRKPKRPACGYAFFTQAQMEAAKEELGVNPRMSSVITLCAKKWKSLTPKQKEPYEKMARESKEQYYKKLKIYEQIIKEEKEQDTGESSKSVNQENNANKVATTTKHVTFMDNSNVENNSDNDIEDSSEEE